MYQDEAGDGEAGGEQQHAQQHKGRPRVLRTRIAPQGGAQGADEHPHDSSPPARLPRWARLPRSCPPMPGNCSLILISLSIPVRDMAAAQQERMYWHPSWHTERSCTMGLAHCVV